MFTEFFTLELRYQLRQLMVYIFFLIMALLVFGAVTSNNVTIGGDTGNVYKNAPSVIAQYTSIMGIIGIVMVTAFMNNAALRDYNHKFDQILFSTPIRKGQYLFGRFLGAYLVSIIPFLGVFAGVMIGCQMPWLDADRVGPLRLDSYLNSLLIFVIPNNFLIGAITFSLAVFFRSTIISFIGAITVLALYIVTQNLVGDLDNESLAMLLDAFAIRTYNIATKYWTTVDKNTLTVSLSGLMLYNRLIWVGVGTLVLIVTYAFFQFSGRTRRAKKGIAAPPVTRPVFGRLKALPKVNLQWNNATFRQQLWSQFKLDFLGTTRGVPFIVLLFIGLAQLLPNLWYVVEGSGDVISYPVTYRILDRIQGSMFLFLFAIVVYYGGELIWKERDAKMDTFYDTYAHPNWVMYLAKILSLCSIIALVLLLCIGSGVLVQLLHGYTRLQLELYFTEMSIQWTFFVMFAVLSMFIHLLVNNKYLGYFLIVAFLIVTEFVVQDALGVDHNLLLFASAPSHTYSDMNGYGPFTAGIVWFITYWLLFSGILAVVSLLIWVRGKETRPAMRWNTARYRLSPRWKQVALGVVILWLLVGGFIFYNTNILNNYQSTEAVEVLQAQYEQKYKQYQSTPQPRITSVFYNIDLEPYERSFEAQTTMTLTNKSSKAIDSLHLTYEATESRTQAIELENATAVLDDSLLGYRIYRLASPLLPGDSLIMTVNSAYQARGFENEVSFTQLNQNGTFFHSSDIVPTIGYDANQELTDRDDRKDHDLPKRDRMPSIDNEAARQNTYISSDADWIRMETTISTASDQIAVAPGALAKEWEENGRRYFHYQLDSAVLHFNSFISARYEVLRDRWQGVDVEVYYHPEHIYNVERMAEAVKSSLAYYTEQFGSYPHQYARIIEFPRYQSFAQAFPGTMPYSEGIGFIENLQDDDSKDRVLHVVAHEMAHQWWAHQVIGADVQGATMLSETMAQYASLMVMKQEKNEKSVRDYRRYEVDRYLRARGAEEMKEVPLWLVENMDYIHYQKGSNVMYALQDYIGEDSVNQALRRYAQEVAYQEPPYTTSRDLLTHFRAVTPDSLQSFVTDLFENITLYSNRTTEATYTKLNNGQYQVDFSTVSEKFYADSLGTESKAPINDWIDIGVYAEDQAGEDSLIYVDRRRITERENTFSVAVDQVPTEAGIDPNMLLVDRVLSDNVIKVSPEVEAVAGL